MGSSFPYLSNDPRKAPEIGASKTLNHPNSGDRLAISCAETSLSKRPNSLSNWPIVLLKFPSIVATPSPPDNKAKSKPITKASSCRSRRTLAPSIV